jgi:hypothetical protein
MYGIVNRAIEDLVKEKFGDAKWDLVKEISGIHIDFFIGNESYDDDLTYKLVQGVSTAMKIPQDEVLESLGEWWVLRTGKEKYGSLLEAGGKNLHEFLIKLPVFHNRVMLIYPHLTPPDFHVQMDSERSALVHYHSKRIGLQHFVRGLLVGLGKMYNEMAFVEIIQSRDHGYSHEIFKISW